MNAKKVIAELEEKYPGKNIVIVNEENPTEIICEIESSEDHPDWGDAVAVIDESGPHYHKKTTEDYTVVKGELNLNIDGKECLIKEGEKITILPGQIHNAKGKEVWVRCFSKPGWTTEDHILVDER